MRSIITAFLIALVSACSTIKINSNSEAVPAGDMNRINEIYRIQSIVSKEVWPGFENAKFRFVMIGKKYQWAINVDPMPEYYKKIDVPKSFNSGITSVGVTEIYRNEIGQKLNEAPAVIYNSFSKENTDLHYNHSIYFVKTLEEFHRIGDQQDAETWIHISLHELFHTFQDQYVRYTPEFLNSTRLPIKKTLPDDVEHNKLLLPEIKLLAKAACSTSKKEMKELLKKSLQLRKKRWAYIHKKYNISHEHWERFESWAEGTAHYTEHQIMARYPLFKNGTLLVDDPYYGKFNEYTKESPAQWCEQIASNQKRKYWYSLGFAYALILDKLIPDWKQDKFDNELFFDAFFKRLNVL